MNVEESTSNYIPDEEKVEDQGQFENDYPNGSNEQKKENSLITMLKSETGEGSIQSYNNHPLNTKGNNYISQIIRGLTGMLGSLNFAILDILLGSFGFVKEKRDNIENVEYTNNESDNFENEHPSYPKNGPTIQNGRTI